MIVEDKSIQPGKNYAEFVASGKSKPLCKTAWQAFWSYHKRRWTRRISNVVKFTFTNRRYRIDNSRYFSDLAPRDQKFLMRRVEARFDRLYAQEIR